MKVLLWSPLGTINISLFSDLTAASCSSLVIAMGQSLSIVPQTKRMGFYISPIQFSLAQSSRSMRFFMFGMNFRNGNSASATLEIDEKVFSRITPRYHSSFSLASLAAVKVAVAPPSDRPIRKTRSLLILGSDFAY